MIRLFLPVEGTPDRIPLSEDRLHYLTRVLRLTEGAELEVFDGKGRAFPAKLSKVGDGTGELELAAPVNAAAVARWIGLVIGLPKGDKLEWVLQKGTELGASAFFPVETRRAVVKLEEKKRPERAKRWQKIVEEAARQCGRSDVPTAHAATSLEDAVAALPPGTQLLVCDEEEHERPLGAAFARAPPSSPVALVFGPEGGLDRSEVSALVERGATPVTLGRRILRAETAPLAALCVVLHRDGDLG